MIPVEEALERILSYVKVLEREGRPLLETLGQVLAQDLYASFDIPPTDNAAMDGYAVRAADTHGATLSRPKVLPVIGEIAAGHPTRKGLRPGSAMRIMTGASIPQGADAVVQFEETDEVERKATGKPLTQIGIGREAEADLNIRRAGEDIARGQVVLRQGTVIRPSEIGVMASLGLARAPVYRRPLVAVLATGDELTEVGRTLPQGKIYNSNAFSIAAQVRRYGGIPRVLGIARDTVASLTRKIQKGLDADLFVTSAGVSTGDYDMVKEVLARHGEINFWTVRMKPGKPLAFGVLRQGERRVPHLGLPGNPVSSMVTFEMFARPAILKMLGWRSWEKPYLMAVSQSRIENKGGLRLLIRALVERRDGQYLASPTGPQGSGILTSMALANGLIVVPEEVALVKEGDPVKVLMLDWNQGQGASQ